MPGFDDLIKWTCWDTVRALPSAGLLHVMTHFIPLPKRERGTQLSSQAHHKSALSDETGKFKYKPNFAGSLGSVVLQLNRDSATSLLAFIINSSFLNGVFKMVLPYLKKD